MKILPKVSATLTITLGLSACGPQIPALSDVQLKADMKLHQAALACNRAGLARDPRVMAAFSGHMQKWIGLQSPQRVERLSNELTATRQWIPPTKVNCRDMDTVAYQWADLREAARIEEERQHQAYLARKQRSSDFGVTQCTDVGAFIHCNSF